METVLGVLNNPWVVGIGAGVLSGLVVAFVSRSVLSRRDQKEYVQRVALANNDILYAIRPGISEKCLPAIEIIQAMISATARKYRVEESSMYDLNDISSELIKEVMDSSFISQNLKKEFCEILGGIKEPEIAEKSTLPEAELEVSTRYRQQLVSTMSILVGALTGGLALVLFWDESGGLLSEPVQIISLAIPAVVAVAIAVGSVLVRDIQRLRLRHMKINFGPLRAELAETRDKGDIKSN